MKLLLKSLAVILNALPKTDWKPIPLCAVYGRYGLNAPNLVGHITAPSVTTGTAGSITTSGVVISTNSITSTGNENPSVEGVCYSSTNSTPTTSDFTQGQSGSFSTGNYNETLSGLSSGTLYYFRAYATNSAGTGYGSASSFTTTANTPPTVALNTPTDTATGVSTTPDLVFTGTDANSDTIEYNVQVDTVNTFNSSGGNPLLNKLSVTPDATFTDVTNGAHTHPFPSAEQVKYTVQAGNTLTGSTTYYWRVAATDPAGSNIYGAWSATWSFTVTASGVKVWDGSAWVVKPIKVWNGSAWVVKG